MDFFNVIHHSLSHGGSQPVHFTFDLLTAGRLQFKTNHGIDFVFRDGIKER